MHLNIAITRAAESDRGMRVEQRCYQHSIAQLLTLRALSPSNDVSQAWTRVWAEIAFYFSCTALFVAKLNRQMIDKYRSMRSVLNFVEASDSVFLTFDIQRNARALHKRTEGDRMIRDNKRSVIGRHFRPHKGRSSVGTDNGEMTLLARRTGSEVAWGNAYLTYPR